MLNVRDINFLLTSVNRYHSALVINGLLLFFSWLLVGAKEFGKFLNILDISLGGNPVLVGGKLFL